MKPRVLFVDFGGTLVAPLPDPFATVAHLLEGLGFEVSKERWAAAERAVTAQLGPRAIELLGQVPSYLDRLHEDVLREMGIHDRSGGIERALHDWFTSADLHPPFPEAEPVLRELRSAGVPVHLVSNNTDWLPEIVENLGWTSYFASVTFSQEAGAEKPDRRIFDLALRRAACAPADVLHAGDSYEADVLGARGAGLGSIWVNRNRRPAPGPCETIEDLRPLLDRLAPSR